MGFSSLSTPTLPLDEWFDIQHQTSCANSVRIHVIIKQPKDITKAKKKKKVCPFVALHYFIFTLMRCFFFPQQELKPTEKEKRIFVRESSSSSRVTSDSKLVEERVKAKNAEKPDFLKSFSTGSNIDSNNESSKIGEQSTSKHKNMEDTKKKKKHKVLKQGKKKRKEGKEKEKGEKIAKTGKKKKEQKKKKKKKGVDGRESKIETKQKMPGLVTRFFFLQHLDALM